MEDQPTFVKEGFNFSNTQRSAWGNLFDVHQRIVNEIDTALQSEHGLTVSEWDALAHLGVSGEEGMTMSELSDTVQLSTSGMSRLVSRLEDRGLVERKKADADARQKRAVVTPIGFELLTEASKTHDRTLQEYFFAVLTEESCEQVAEILEKVLDHTNPDGDSQSS